MLKTLLKFNTVLGINERNHEYVRKYNNRSARLIADNKVLTKKTLREAEIPTPKTIKIIKNRKQLDQLDLESLPKSFVVKPVNGYEGSGIEIIYNRNKKGQYICAKSKKLLPEELIYHMRTILEGRYSHNYNPDHVLIEERIQPHHAFRVYTYKGTPDIRIVLFKRVPVMAMVRWPTIESHGKANLSQGAVGSGVDLSSGIVTNSIQEDKTGKIRLVEFVPGSKVRYSGFKIPYWNKILTYATKSADVTGLGFCAVDFLIDRKEGPMIVELNARPGLRVQIANQDGLKWRLEQVKKLKVKSTAHAIRLGKDMFGGEVEEEIEAIAGKSLIALNHPVKLYHKYKPTSITIKAKVDTGAGFSSIDPALARQLGFKDALKHFESFQPPEYFESFKEAKTWSHIHAHAIVQHPDITRVHIISSGNGFSCRAAVEVKIKVNDSRFHSEINIRDRSQLQYPMILGKKALKNFLIDPSKRMS